LAAEGKKVAASSLGTVSGWRRNNPSEQVMEIARNPSVPFVLPKIDVANFTGRQDELLVLELQLLGTNQDKTCSIVGLSGGGGMGKSALAFHFATLHRDKFPDGVIGLPVDGKAVHEVARDFARRCGKEVDEDDDRSASTIMQEVFAHRRMLLIFDNADQSVLKELRPGGNRCALIVTTRDRQIPDSFGISTSGIIDLPPMPKEDARNLLREILEVDRINAELAAADSIIEMTGGLPLALQIAGSALRGRQRSLASYVESLKDERTRVQRLQIRGDRDLNVTASLNLSLELLEESEIHLFACLSVCAKDGFSLRTAMVAGGIEDEWEARDLLDRLYQLSLLNEVSADRYVFHALVRVYAQKQAQDKKLWDAASQRHAGYFLDLVKSNNVESLEIAAHLTEDFDDVLQAAQWLRMNAASDELKVSAYQFALDLRPFLLKYNYSKKAIELMFGFQEWAESLNDWNSSVKFRIQQAKYLILERKLIEAEEILRNAQDSIDQISDLHQRQEIQAKQLNSLGGVLQKQRRFEEAIYVLEQEVKIEEEINDQKSLAIILNRLGRLFQRQGRIEQAIAAFERQIDIAKTLNDWNCLIIGLNCLGGVFQQVGRLEEAIAAFEYEIEISETLDDQNKIAISLNRLGGLFRRQGLIKEAIATFERQIKISEVLDEQKQVSIGLNCLGSLFQQQGLIEEAIATFERQIKISEPLNDQKQLLIGLNCLGGLFQQQGLIEEAIATFERTLVIEEGSGSRRRLIIKLIFMGDLLRQQNRFRESIEKLRQAVEISMLLDGLRYRTKSSSMLAAMLHEYSYTLLEAPSTRDEAEAILDESYEIYKNIGDSFQAAVVLHSLGRALKGMKRFENAERVLQKCRDIFYNLQDNKQLLMVLNTLGGVLERKQDWKAAELVLRESYDLAFKEKDLLSQAIVSNSLGKLFARQKGDEKFSLADMYFTNSIKLGRMAEDKDHLYKAYFAWGKALMYHGRPESALIELNHAFEIEENLSNPYRLQAVLPPLTSVLAQLGMYPKILEYADRAIAATNNHPTLIKYREITVKSMPFSRTPSLKKKNS
jgi:tetratricopeptide (TPR) repeat protein